MRNLFMLDIDIFLVTYNREKQLRRTLNAFFDINSPIKNYSLTVLDNHSTDDTRKTLKSFARNHKNLEIICNPVNIGGVANICRAYELSLNKDGKYVWVLCDDDLLDFSGWTEVEEAVNNNADLICVCDYALPENLHLKELLPHFLLQMTFVPAGIYKKDLLTSDVMQNMYLSIYTALNQCCISIEAINKKKNIMIIKNEIVHNGLYAGVNTGLDYSYTRGQKNILKRQADNVWILGYSNILTLLKDEKLRKKAMEIALNSKFIFAHGIADFLDYQVKDFVVHDDENYLMEIYKSVSLKYQCIIKQYAKKYRRQKNYYKTKDFIKRRFPKIFAFLKKLWNRFSYLRKVKNLL